MQKQWIRKFSVSVSIIFISILLPVLAFASETIGNAIDDTLITAQVKAAFVINDITHDQAISVETNNGIVILKGTVDSQTQATAAIQIAQETQGVKQVDASQLYVPNSKQPFKDIYITTKVKMILLSHGLSSAKVETENGVVYLSGFVSDAKQRESAVNLTKSVSGVAQVKSDLAIK